MKGKGPLLSKLPRATAMRPLSRRGKRKLMDSQASIFETPWIVYPFSREPSQPKGQTQVSCTEGGFFTNWATKEVWSLKLHFLIHRKFLACRCLSTGPNSGFQWYYIWGKSNSILITMVLFVWCFMFGIELDDSVCWLHKGGEDWKGQLRGKENINTNTHTCTHTHSWFMLLYGRNQHTQWNYEPCHVGPPKTDGSWWRVLTKCGPLEKGMANHFSTLALGTPFTLWNTKREDTERWNPQISRCPICYWRSVVI